MWISLARRLAVAWFPANCCDCRAALGWNSVSGLCLECRSGLERWEGVVLCPGCALPLDTAGGGDLGQEARPCPSCRMTPPRWLRVACLRPYTGRARRLLLRGKMGADRRILREIGTELAAATRVWRLGADCDCVVPVPSHPWANLRRGFSPAAEIAVAIARVREVPLRRNLLRTALIGPTTTKSKSGSARRRQLPTRFSCRRRLRGARVLLVDDVMTTGTTLKLCTRTLLEAGAGSVEAAVWARSL